LAEIVFVDPRCAHMRRSTCFFAMQAVPPALHCPDVAGASADRGRKSCVLEAFSRQQDERLLGAPFWAAVNEDLNKERVHRQHSMPTARFAGQLSLLPWMQNHWLNDEGFRSFRRHLTLSALHAAGGMSQHRFGPGPAESSQNRAWKVVQQEFVVYRPVCFDAELGFFQTNADGSPVRMEMFSAEARGGPVYDTRILEMEVSWVAGSTFAANPWDLHVPHFFWELHAMFSLGLYSSGALQFDRLLILDDARWWNCSSYPAKYESEKLASGAQNLSFFEEHVISAVVSKAANWCVRAGVAWARVSGCVSAWVRVCATARAPVRAHARARARQVLCLCVCDSMCG
jgi:hypothetical protein